MKKRTKLIFGAIVAALLYNPVSKGVNNFINKPTKIEIRDVELPTTWKNYQDEIIDSEIRYSKNRLGRERIEEVVLFDRNFSENTWHYSTILKRESSEKPWRLEFYQKLPRQDRNYDLQSLESHIKKILDIVGCNNGLEYDKHRPEKYEVMPEDREKLKESLPWLK